MFRSSSTSSPLVSTRICLPNLLTEITDQPYHLLEQRTNRNHAHRHGRPLNFVGDPRQLRKIPSQPAVSFDLEVGIMTNQRLRDHHFADHVDEIIELVCIDFDGSGSCFRVLRSGNWRYGFTWRRHLDRVIRLSFGPYALKAYEAVDSAQKRSVGIGQPDGISTHERVKCSQSIATESPCFQGSHRSRAR